MTISSVHINLNILECKFSRTKIVRMYRDNINLNILECKLTCHNQGTIMILYINLNILECKYCKLEVS